MLNKTLIALTATVVLGSASAAFAYEEPENRIGDRYPFLEQMISPVQGNHIGNSNLISRQFARADQFSNEEPENRIGDRYPLLEPMVRPVSTGKFAGKYLAMRYASNSINQSAYEEAENKIGDRYPLLEPQVASQQVASQRGPARRFASRGTRTTGSIR